MVPALVTFRAKKKRLACRPDVCWARTGAERLNKHEESRPPLACDFSPPTGLENFAPDKA